MASKNLPISPKAAVGICVLALCAGVVVAGSSLQPELSILPAGEGREDASALQSENSAAQDGVDEGVVPQDQLEQPSNSAGTTAQNQAPSLFVHVVGAVREPGVYELAAGSRVSDAVAAAGGVTTKASIDSVNLARALTDGEQVQIPTKSQVKKAQQSDGSSGVAADGAPSWESATEAGTQAAGQGKVNINTASAAELETLNGIGPATAQKIIDDRQANGPFASVDDLKRVSGIGDKKLEAIRESISVG